MISAAKRVEALRVVAGSLEAGQADRVVAVRKGPGEVETLDPPDLEAAYSSADARAFGISIHERSQPDSPEIDLYCAIVQDAVECLLLDDIKKDGTVDHALRRERVRARKWLDGEVTSAEECSFAEICEHTDSNPTVLRRLILKHVEQVLQARSKKAVDEATKAGGARKAPPASKATPPKGRTARR